MAARLVACVPGIAVIYCKAKLGIFLLVICVGQDVTLKVSNFIIFKVFFLALLIDFLNVILTKKICGRVQPCNQRTAICISRSECCRQPSVLMARL